MEAAAAVGRVKWPKPERASLVEILSVGVVSSDRMTQSQAVEIYLSSLANNTDARLAQVISDAQAHLEAARGLAFAAAAAADSIRPTVSDVSVVEAAIGELREARDIYVAALKMLSSENDAVDAETVHTVKGAFNAAIAEVGVAADRLAEAVAQDRTSTYAGHDLRPDGFGGSF
ncbi:hypothetical protein [Amphiplicatus metriothermophilus]|uniref:hypothetical protein n=1 Tax=Amphiplicatus metriothermophilus TaxID=1519374 RepID=UPI000B7765F0|nr:hypothetical protein [Amphiplicatus metriothermophilus]MBB5518379.1 hypothetical protein [Amphiplicatus metriothermophilus]